MASRNRFGKAEKDETRHYTLPPRKVQTAESWKRIMEEKQKGLKKK
jgi:hypothetical protein